MDQIASESLELIWHAIDNLEHRAEELATRDLREIAWEEQLLLARMSLDGVPPEVLAEVVSLDFIVPELRAAYRLVREHAGDVAAARRYASDPDVAGALDAILSLARLIGSRSSSPPRRYLHRGWYRRQLLSEVERLIATAEQLIADEAAGSVAWEACRRAVDAMHDRTRAFLHDDAPPAQLTLVTTPRGQLLGTQSDPVVVLEDTAVAEKIVELVLAADHRVLVAVPWVREDPLAEAFATACIRRAASGVRVLVVTRPIKAARGYEPARRGEVELHRRLSLGGVELAYDSRVHDKLFVVDDTVVLGSTNLTPSDIRVNHNSAAGFATASAVEQCVRRIESLASPPAIARPRIADRDLPVYAYCYDGLVHRLKVDGAADWTLLEGADSESACGEEVTVDSASRIAAALRGDACWDCDTQLG